MDQFTGSFGSRSVLRHRLKARDRLRDDRFVSVLALGSDAPWATAPYPPHLAESATPLEQKDAAVRRFCESPLTDSNRRPLLTLGFPRQPVATRGNGLGLFEPFSRSYICHRLRPVATAGLHKGPILCCHTWLPELRQKHWTRRSAGSPGGATPRGGQQPPLRCRDSSGIERAFHPGSSTRVPQD